MDKNYRNELINAINCVSEMKKGIEEGNKYNFSEEIRDYVSRHNKHIGNEDVQKK